jgi:hypothetical protein
LYFRKHLQPLVTAIEKEDYEINMDKIEGNSRIKQELKTLKTKLKGKMEDEIIDGFIGVAKQYGPPAISFIVNLLFKNNPTPT